MGSLQWALIQYDRAPVRRKIVLAETATEGR